MYGNKQIITVEQGSLSSTNIYNITGKEKTLAKLEDCEKTLRELNIRCKDIVDKIKNDFSLNAEFEDYRRYLHETDYRYLTWGKYEPKYAKPPKRHIHIFNSKNNVYDLKIYNNDGDYQIYEWHTGTDYAIQLFLAEDKEEKERLAIAIIETWRKDPLTSVSLARDRF